MRQSHDLRATVARRSWERREAVDGNKCSQFHRANIVRVSRECRTNVARMSWNIRQWFVRQSYDIRATVANMSYAPIRCDRNVIMVAMSYFCRQNVSQISLEIVVNCSHPSEILALSVGSVNQTTKLFADINISLYLLLAPKSVFWQTVKTQMRIWSESTLFAKKKSFVSEIIHFFRKYNLWPLNIYNWPSFIALHSANISKFWIIILLHCMNHYIA